MGTAEGKVQPERDILMLAVNRGFPIMEAWSREAFELAAIFGADVIASGPIDELWHREGRYLNIKRSLLGNLVTIGLFTLKGRGYRWLYLAESPASKTWCVLEGLFKLGVLPLDRAIVDMHYPLSLDKSYFAQTVIPRCKAIKVTDRWSVGQIRTRYPQAVVQKAFWVTGVNVEKINVKPILDDPGRKLRLLFASAPREHQDDFFLVKGIDLMLDALADLKGVDLTLLWRGAMHDEIQRRISEARLQNMVALVDRYVDMQSCYSHMHATIFTPTNLTYSRHYPASVMESLAAGRPVVVSSTIEIAEIVHNESCGVVCRPESDSLVEAIEELRANYLRYQSNARRVAETHFDIHKNSQRLREFLFTGGN